MEEQGPSIIQSALSQVVYRGNKKNADEWTIANIRHGKKQPKFMFVTITAPGHKSRFVKF